MANNVQIKKLQDLKSYVLNPGDVPGEGDFMPVVDMDGDSNNAGAAVPEMRKLELKYLKNLMLTMAAPYMSRMTRSAFEAVTGFKPAPQDNTEGAQEATRRTGDEPQEITEIAQMLSAAYEYMQTNVLDIDGWAKDGGETDSTIYPFLRDGFADAVKNTCITSLPQLDETIGTGICQYVAVELVGGDDLTEDDQGIYTAHGLRYAKEGYTVGTGDYNNISVYRYYDPGKAVLQPVQLVMQNPGGDKVDPRDPGSEAYQHLTKAVYHGLFLDNPEHAYTNSNIPVWSTGMDPSLPRTYSICVAFKPGSNNVVSYTDTPLSYIEAVELSPTPRVQVVFGAHTYDSVSDVAVRTVDLTNPDHPVWTEKKLFKTQEDNSGLMDINSYYPGQLALRKIVYSGGSSPEHPDFYVLGDYSGAIEEGYTDSNQRYAVYKIAHNDSGWEFWYKNVSDDSDIIHATEYSTGGKSPSTSPEQMSAITFAAGTAPETPLMTFVSWTDGADLFNLVVSVPQAVTWTRSGDSYSASISYAALGGGTRYFLDAPVQPGSPATHFQKALSDGAFIYDEGDAPVASAYTYITDSERIDVSYVEGLMQSTPAKELVGGVVKMLRQLLHTN